MRLSGLRICLEPPRVRPGLHPYRFRRLVVLQLPWWSGALHRS